MINRISISRMLAAVALLALTVPMPAFSQSHEMPMKEHKGGHAHGRMMESGSMDKMDNMMGMCMANAEKMGLSSEQVTKMKPMHFEMQKNQARFKADLKIAEIELAEIMDVKDFDLEKANAATKKISDIKTAHHLEMLKAMKEMRTSLTDDQYKKMKTMMNMKMGDKKPVKKMMKK